MSTRQRIILLFFVSILLFLNQSIALENELKSPSSIGLDREGNIYALGGKFIYKYNQEGNFMGIINQKTDDIYGKKDVKENTSYVGSIQYINGKRTSVGKRIEQKDIEDFAKYFRTNPSLEDVIQRVIYPTQITVGPDGNIYVVGQDIFRESYKLGILDPEDGHPIEVFPAADEDVLKTRAQRLGAVINERRFEKKEELKDYILKNKELINSFALRTTLEKILTYIPYDETYGKREWSNFRKKIIIEWHKGEILYPHGIAVDSEGNFYIANHWDNKVKVFNRKGEFVRAFGGYGKGDGQFRAIEAIAVDDKNGYIYVTENYFPTMFRGSQGEPNQMRVQKFTKDGEFVLKWGESKYKGFRLWPPAIFYEDELNEPDGIAVDSNGDVYVLCSYTAEVKKYTGDGELIMKWGKVGTGEGEMKDPQAIAIDKDDNVYVADTENNRIQKFDSEGKFLMEIK